MDKTRDEIEAVIAAISEQLKGPMPNLERALLVADRKEAREELAKLPPRTHDHTFEAGAYGVCKRCGAERH